jgi:hypothetical protein
MPSVQCPRCGRAIAVSADELRNGIQLECADCYTCFAVGAPREPAPVSIRPVPSEPEDITDNSTESIRPTRRSSKLPVILGLVGGLLVVSCCGGTGLLLSVNKRGDAAAKTNTTPFGRPSAPPPAAFSDPALSRRGQEAADWNRSSRLWPDLLGPAL